MGGGVEEGVPLLFYTCLLHTKILYIGCTGLSHSDQDKIPYAPRALVSQNVDGTC